MEKAEVCEVSVVMGIYEEQDKRQVMQAIDSILDQTFRDFEFIICDDGSGPAFYGWLDRYCRKDSRIILLRNKKNMGLAAALNKCLKHASGQYIARMDADDISCPRRLEEQAAFLRRHKGYALVGCNAQLIDRDGVWGLRRLERVPRRESFLCTSPFIHPAVMVRRLVLEELGGYCCSPKVRRIEDYELFMRMYAEGYRGYNLQEPLFRYRESVQAYAKRRYRYRLNECRVRYHGFRALGILAGNLRYVWKPLAVGLIPARFMAAYRKKKYACISGRQEEIGRA